jgi:phosphoribosylformimino-5-aminoimidazole carboxamide ribotide isomerase
MMVLPAIDLRSGHAVQLVGGVPGTERVRLPDPVGLARHWTDSGFAGLHVVDLDAALGSGSNRSIVEDLIAASAVPCQVGGGIRDANDVDALVDAGAARIIVGTRAIEDRAWLERMALSQPGRLVVAADVRAGTIVTRGWTQTTSISAGTFIESLDALPLAGVLVTDVGREGRLQGVDSGLFQSLTRRTALPLQAAGGVASLEDLRALETAGAAAAILGMALYTGGIDPATAAREFAT